MATIMMMMMIVMMTMMMMIVVMMKNIAVVCSVVDIELYQFINTKYMLFMQNICLPHTLLMKFTKRLVWRFAPQRQSSTKLYLYNAL